MEEYKWCLLILTKSEHGFTGSSSIIFEDKKSCEEAIEILNKIPSSHDNRSYVSYRSFPLKSK